MGLRRCVLVWVSLLLGVIPSLAYTFPVPSVSWQQGAALATPRSFATATLLNDGRIVIVGGKDGSGNPLASVEIFQSDGTVVAGPAMGTPRYGHSAILLGDGRVLVAGGHTTGGTVVNTAEIFDGTTNTWSAVSNVMTDARADFAMSPVSGGDVLAIGGDNGTGPVASIDRFNLPTGSFQYQASLTAARKSHAASVLRDGRVLITGGNGVGQGGTTVPLSLTEIYDPSSNTVTGGPTLNAARFAHSSTTLVDGTVLIAGGNNGSTDLASLEIFDPVAGTITMASATLAAARSGHVALLLPNNGGVLIAGGSSAGVALGSSEIYQSWNTTVLGNGEMSAARDGAAASALQLDGTALVAGGSNLGSTDLYGFATVRTDAADYAPGTPVNITGSGWVPGETVTLSLRESPFYDTPPAMTAVADAQGHIANSSFAPDSYDVGVRFYLKAAGSQSQALNTFTDRVSVSVTLSSSPTTWVVGQQVTFNVATTQTGGGTVSEGCVQLLDGTSQIGYVQTASANFNINFSTLGQHAIKAVYVDNGGGQACGNKGSNYSDTDSNTLTQTVLGQSATTVSTSASSSTFGQAVTFTAALSAVTPSTGIPGGTVSFYDAAGGATCSNLASSSLLGTQTGSGSVSVSVSTLAAGTHSVLACYAGSSSFAASSGTVTQIVNQATPTVSWVAATSIAYGTALNSTQLNATASYQNNGSPVTVAGTFTYTPASGTVLSAGQQTLSVHFVPTDTTDFATPADKTVTLTVSQVTVTAAITASNKVYDGNNSASFTCALSGVLPVDAANVSCTGGSATFASSSVGNGITVTASGLTLTGLKASNYVLGSSTATTTANITAKGLTVTGVMANDKTYDGSATATLNLGGAVLQGVVGTDDVTLNSSSYSASFNNKTAGSGKSVTVAGLTLSGAKASNYTLTQPTGLSANIFQKALTVTGVMANEKTYDGNTSATLNTASAVLVGAISGDAVTLNVTSATGNFGDKTAATNKVVTVSGLVLAGADAGNYTLTQPTATATIDKKNLTVSGVSAGDKVYDGNTTAMLNTSSAALVGVVAGDSVTLSASTAAGVFANKNVGTTKPVNVTGITLSGADAGNYTLTQPAVSASITPLPLTATVTVQNKTYDGTTAAHIVSENVTGVLGADVVTLTGGTATFSDKNAGAGKSVNVSGLLLSGADSTNYSVNGSTTTTANITPRGLDVTALGTTKVYDGTVAATVSLQDDRVAGDSLTEAYSSASFADKNIGTAKPIAVTGISISGGSDAGNYVLANTTAAATGSITVRPMMVTATADDKTYDGTAAAAAHLTDNRISGDSVTDAYIAATFSDKNAGVGKTVTVSGISISGTDAGNYSLSNTSATATASITARSLAISATGQSRKYDGTTVATVTLSDNRIAGDSLTASYVGASFVDKNVGAAKTISVTGITISGQDAANYIANTTATASASVTQRLVTITAIADSKVYDATTVSSGAPTISGDGLAAGDSATLSQVFDTKNVGTSKTLTPTGTIQDGNGGANYQVSFVASHSGVITQRALHVSATGVNKEYDGTSTAAVTLSDDHIAGDGVTDSYTSSSFADKNVGMGKVVSVSGISLAGVDALNYSLVNSTASTVANVTARLLTVTASAADKTYDGSTSAIVTLGDNRIAGDVFTDSQTGAVFDTKNVGPGKTVTVSGISISGTDAGNYNLASTTAVATASILARQLTVTATAADKIYDGTLTATVTLADNHITGDSVTDSYAGASFIDKNVGAGKAITVTGISITGPDAANYTVSLTAATSASITQRPVTITAMADSKTYDATPTATAVPAISGMGLAPGDGSTLSEVFDNKNAGTGKTLTPTGTIQDGNNGANYQITFVPSTTGTITPRALHVTAGGVDKQYDGTTAATVTLSDDHIAGDAVTDSYTSAAFSDKNVGSGKAVAVSGISFSGTDASNYALANTAATASASITQRTLTVTATVAARVYDGTTTATVTLGDNRIAGDSLTESFSNATYADKNVGPGKTVSVTGISVSGADAGDYLLGNVTATATGDITARPIGVTAVTDSKTYDGTATSSKTPTISSGSLASGDSATFSQVFDSKNAGSRSLVPAATISDGNGGNNYSVTLSNTAGTINPLGITASIAAMNKTYDGTATAIFSCSLSGVLSGDTVSCSGGSASFSAPDAGTWTVTATGLTLTGAGAGNYTTNNSATTTGVISKANQMISWTTPAPIVYGTALSSTQLNALVSGVAGGTAPGALTYTPSTGSVPAVGTNVLTVTAAPTNNYNAASATVTIVVSYSTGACGGDIGHSILQPINTNGTSGFKQGSTVPAKFRVCDAHGNSVGTPGVVQSFNIVGVYNGTATETIDQSVDSTTPDSSFRWDPTGQQWIFNISTKSMAVHDTYIFAIVLNDGSVINFSFGLPK